ncbi:MAG: DUF4367 domain-containing protein [Bacillota bacterium]|nr:DUF4367 domain-containing protein [Bacillota bacterium]
MLHFKNAEEKRLMFLQSPMPMESTLDTENVIVENIKVLGLDGFYIKKIEFGILLWHDDETVFQIAGWLTKKDLFKIAESIEFVR